MKQPRKRKAKIDPLKNTLTGKNFEAKFKQAANEQNILFVRFRDAGYQGETTTERRFTIKNIADCFLFNDNLLAICELKKRNSSLAFKDITQYKDLKKVQDFIKTNNYKNAISGLVVCLGNNLDHVFFLPTNEIENLQNFTGKKSFNIKDCKLFKESYPGSIFIIGTLIPPRKRTERLDMDFLNHIA